MKSENWNKDNDILKLCLISVDTVKKNHKFGVKDEHDDNLHLVHIYNLWK